MAIPVRNIPPDRQPVTRGENARADTDWYGYWKDIGDQVRLISASEAASPGWVAPTGTPTRATFDTSSVTLPALAEHVKALIDDLIARGLLGP